jgi:hypothetical protein
MAGATTCAEEKKEYRSQGKTKPLHRAHRDLLFHRHRRQGTVLIEE